ncbi:hypothetical protein [Dendronalium sp. ChiSLP03b]|uniref:hypothetical protein n=1 Tax=Dendronalium sp. ChiSLP03b TaxID=3075381 RepID=UPI002AD4D620|nr:hypothetical protein [Dendronalium sp. ChiSLP03b]MDZ8208177.1 hypothetical protein [Dendronalium sp. ChiSLP03b]
MVAPRRRIKWKKFLEFIIRLLQWVWNQFYDSGKLIINWLKKVLKSFINYFKHKPIAILVLLLLLICILTVFAGIAPSTNNFDGSLVVQQLGFTYNGKEENKLFINNIRGITKFLVDGRQTLTLTGKFTSPSQPKLNDKLARINTLTIELLQEKSQWSIVPADSKSKSKLTLSELRLQPQITIDSFSYNPYNHRLAFLFLSKTALDKSAKPNLILNLSEQPLKITFTGYRLPELGLQDNQDTSNQLELIVKPNNSELRLLITNNTNLSIDLPEPNQVDYEEWFQGDLAVINMQFNKVYKTGINVNDDLEKSTINNGDIRMGERNLKVESHQFLMIEKPGVERLQHLAVIPAKTTKEVELRINGESVDISEPPEGIEVRIAGKSKQIQVGIDPRLPVNSLQSNLLASWGLANDVVIAIISFFSAIIVSLLTWLINDFLSWLKENDVKPRRLMRSPYFPHRRK